MAAPHQNIADILVLQTADMASDDGEQDFNGDAPVGLKLAAARMAKGLTHADVHAGTKIKVAHVAAIETGDKEALPATPFAAGFVKAYAQFLGLDAEAFARDYKQKAGFVPLAAPTLAAAMREASQARAAAAPARHYSPELSPAAEPSPLSVSRGVAAPAHRKPEPAPELFTRRPAIDAETIVSWLGAGAAIAVVALIAGRALSPATTRSQPAPAATASVLAAPPVPEPAILEPPASAAVSATAPADPIEPSPAKASIVPPKLKPTPKKPAAEQSPAAPIDLPPAPVEATPSPIEATPATIEDPPAPTGAAEAAIEATPAPVLFTAPPIESPVETPAAAAPEPVAEPTIVAARVTRAAVAVYPERCATRAGEKVGVSVLFSVTTEGKPISASVVASDNRCFNTAAVRAVYDMRFSPRTIDGAPAVETGKTVTVQFVR